jgi:hypothetical protein
VTPTPAAASPELARSRQGSALFADPPDAEGALDGYGSNPSFIGGAWGVHFLPKPDGCHLWVLQTKQDLYRPTLGWPATMPARLPHPNLAAGNDPVLKSITAPDTPDVDASGEGRAEHSSPNEVVRV